MTTTYRTHVLVGDLALLAGVTGRDRDGGPVSGIAAQTDAVMDRILDRIAEFGEGWVVGRIRVSVTDIGEWPTVRDVLVRRLGSTLPPATVVGVTELVEPWMRIEIEAEAVRSVTT